MGHAVLGAENYASLLRFNGHDAVGLAVTQLPGANALDVDRLAKEELKVLSKNFPPGMKYAVAFDSTTVVGESIKDVLQTLVEAVLLVIVVIYLFLQDWRSTFIPAITIPVSLVGTFIFVKLFGFSINTLTLFGITLATGLVVDDAIVVIENVERHITEGITEPHNAASVAMKEVAGAVIATSLVLVAVFVPVALFPGHDRHFVPAIRADDRILGFDFGVQRADADAGAVGDFSGASSRTRAGRVFPRVQPRRRMGDGEVSQHGASRHRLAIRCVAGVRGGAGRDLLDLPDRPARIHP